MSLIPWLDAAYPPTPAQAEAAFNLGYRGCGFYLNGADGDEDPLNTWTPAQVAVLVQAGLAPVPIWVPDPNLASDPTDAATEAFQSAVAAGLEPKESVLYDGNHLTQTGQINGPVWLPIPGPTPTAVGARSAIQWGGGNIGGWSVDYNVAAADFPFSHGLVVDFEYNTAAGTVGLDWYHTFQAHITALAAPTPQPSPTPSPTPVTTGAILQSTTISVTTDGNGNGWTNSPVSPDVKIVSVVPTNTDPPQIGGYIHVPAFAGITSNNVLVFTGGQPNGSFAYYVWSVS